ncbi:MAG: hypothetical protein ACFB12_16530 [Leptolyngbyaceae cyanobacterium]
MTRRGRSGAVSSSFLASSDAVSDRSGFASELAATVGITVWLEQLF